MSLDASLKSANALARHRNVLKRDERVVKLEENDKFPEGRSPMGLPKVGHRKLAVGKKTKKKGAEEEAK